MRIEGQQIYLTPITYEDTDDIVRWRNQDFVRKNFLYRKDFTIEGHNNWLETVVMQGRAVQFIIWEKKDDIKIGSVYLRDIDKQNKKCEFGIFIGEENKTGLGYGKEAALLVTDFAFKKLGMNKVFLRVLAENKRAYHSYLNAGFKKEGLFHEDVWLDGKAEDIIFMAKFNNYKSAGEKKISIVIPCYNVERYLDRCIHSLVSQTIGIDALQLIFVNDASTDRTERKLTYWQQKYPESIEVITLPENRRQGGARNEGMKHIIAPFTGFIDSDDWVAPDMFETLYTAMQEDNYDFVCCFMKRVFSSKENLNSQVQEDRVIQIRTLEERKNLLIEKLPGGIVCKLYRTEFLRQNAVPFPEHMAYEDNYWGAFLWLKTSLCKIIGKELYYYYVNPNSTILSQDSGRHFDRLVIEEMKIQEYKKTGIFETYYREFEFQFLRVYYINSLHTFFLRISDMGSVPFEQMQAKVKEYFPDYLNNPYLERFNSLQMELLKTLELTLTKDQWQVLADNYRKMMNGES